MAANSVLFTQARRVFLTGGSRGIGSSIRKEFESHGHTVVCPSRAELDLADEKSILKFLAGAADLEVDILINNAGINFPGAMEKIDLANWSSTVQVNLTAPFMLSRHFAQGMRQRKWGRILNVSSVFSLITREGRSVYSATKSGLNGLTRTSALEWGADGVLVNAICPGFINTDLTRQNNTPADIERLRQGIALKRLAEPDEIAKMAAFLCSDTNSYMTGQCVVVDGGFSLQ